MAKRIERTRQEVPDACAAVVHPVDRDAGCRFSPFESRLCTTLMASGRSDTDLNGTSARGERPVGRQPEARRAAADIP